MTKVVYGFKFGDIPELIGSDLYYRSSEVQEQEATVVPISIDVHSAPDPENLVVEFTLTVTEAEKNMQEGNQFSVRQEVTKDGTVVASGVRKWYLYRDGSVLI